MGCSRPGATAVVCVLAAGVLSILSLVLPYWSKMHVSLPTNERLEVTYGLWGACVDVQPSQLVVLDAPTIMNGSEVIAVAPEGDNSEAFTCGSYYHPEVIRISCTSFKQLATGQCKRREYEADGTLCESDVAIDFLGDGVEKSTVVNWLSFLERACGATGHAAVTFALASSVATGLSFVLLFFGITCLSIESCLGRMGAWCALSTAIFQTVIAMVWIAETRVINGQQFVLATSFYLNFISIVLHFISFVAARKHQRLEKDAHAELDVPDLDHENNQQPSGKEGAKSSGSKEISLVAV